MSNVKFITASSHTNIISYDIWGKSNNNIFNLNGGNVGVGTPTPQALLDVSGSTILRTPIIRVGIDAGVSNQGTNSIAIGIQAGMSNQDASAIAIGFQAGMLSQSSGAISIGFQAGMCNQGTNSVAIGTQAGMLNQGNNAVAIGFQAGMSNQGGGAVAVGAEAGESNQGLNAVAIGNQAGQINQGVNAVAIGAQSGMCNQGQNSICIGQLSTSTFENSIVINATGIELASDNSNAFYVKPIDVSNGINNFLVYNQVTGKISYNTNTTKTFVIDHPLDDSKHLVHACLEGPEAGVYYRGEAEITNNQSTEVILPVYTNNFTNFSIQLTPIDKFIKLSSSKVEGNKFTVFGENGSFYYHVYGTRQTINVTPSKFSTNVEGQGPYKYIN